MGKIANIVAAGVALTSLAQAPTPAKEADAYSKNENRQIRADLERNREQESYRRSISEKK